MRYSPKINAFPMKHWRKLWKNNIADFEQLRTLARTTGLVAIDMESYCPDR